MTGRAEVLAGRLVDAGVDALLVTSLLNVRYLTGFTGSNGAVVVGSGISRFLTDARYAEQSAEEVDGSFERSIGGTADLLPLVEEALAPGHVRLGFEDAHLTVWQLARLRELLPERVELVPLHGLVEEQRRVKSEQELDRIRAAAALADDAFRSVTADGLIGRSERSVATALEFAMRERGAERASFDTIVAAGPHAALPHATPRDVMIERGQLVVIDWGAVYDGYSSDCTRTVAAGEPGNHEREIYELLLAAQEAAVESIATGTSGREADAAARTVIETGGYGPFALGLGHGVGLNVHEAPRLAQTSEDMLAAGMVVTVEPGIYIPGDLGVRIEDLCVVTDEACEILTSIDKQLAVVD